MTIVPMLAVGIIMKMFAALFVICSIVLILVVLIQKGKGGGLSGALAGGAASGLLGSKTGDFLTWVTIIVVAVFLTVAIVMAKFYRPGIIYGTGRQVETRRPVDQPPATEVPGGSTDANTAGK